MNGRRRAANAAAQGATNGAAQGGDTKGAGAIAMRRRRTARFVTIAIPLATMVPGALAFPVQPALAQGIDLTQGGPIQITSQDGIEWRQAEQIVIARGDAKAVRGNVTVTADQLIAWYRRKGEPATARPVAVDATGSTGATGTSALPGATDTEGNEVFRMRAEGNVHIHTVTDQGWGDQATYDLDQAVLVMTGRNLKLTTPDNTLTARDTLEYWSQKHMAVARGDAVVVTNDAKRISADTLVAYTVEAPPAGTGPATPGVAPVRPAPQGRNAAAPPSPAPAIDSMASMAGRLERVEAFNNVSVRTLTDIVTGDRAVYVPDTGIAHLGGHVRISRGQNQVNGSQAVVNMKTGIATLLAGDGDRVKGLMIPNDQSNPPSGNNTPNKAPASQPVPGGTR